jgi:hypothetical protein
MRVLGKPIKGVQDGNSEVALLFAEAVAGEARKYVDRRSMDAERVAAEHAGAQAAAAAAGMQSMVQQAHEEVSELSRRPPPSAVALSCALLAFLGSAVAAVAVSPLFVVLVVGAMVATGVLYSRLEAEKGRRRTAIVDAQQRQGDCGARMAQAQATAQERAAYVAELGRRREAHRPERVLRAVGRVYVPLTIAKVAGYPIVVDRSGVLPKVSLRLPDLATRPEVLERIRRTVADAQQRPVLLRGDSEAPSEMDEVLGEERALHRAVTDFTEMVEAIPTVEASLPLLPNDSALVRYLVTEEFDPAATPGQTVRLDPGDAIAAAARRVTDVASRMRTLGSQADRTMRDLYQGLSVVLKDFGELRADALDHLHQGLQQILQRSDLAYVTYYCPRCNRVPAYLFHRVGVDVDQAHELSPEALLSALQNDDEARERITRDETLATEIGSAWGAARELDESIRKWEETQRTNANRVGPSITELQAFESRMRALRAQRAQALEQFRSTLTRALTGNPRPLLELSRQARLHRDPDKESWTCAACAMVFDDPVVARMGRMLKVKDELLMPMWNHLWTEKDDLRKTELFRTNEQIQRLMEKEATALRDVAEQYRADMRSVRENLIVATSEAAIKKDQLETTVESLTALGAISKDEASAWVGRLMSLTGGDLTDLRKRAEAKETLLNQEPQAQLNRRIPAIDPVQVFMTPGALFHHAAVGPAALKLAAPVVEEAANGG